MKPTYDIAVDVDDVLFAFCDKAHEICERAGIANGGTITQWQFHLDYGISSEDLWATLDPFIVSGELYEGWPIYGTTGQLRRLRGFGHRIHLVTARGFGPNGSLVEAHTRAWVRNWNVPFDTLTFSQDKTIVHSDFALDDNVKNYAELEAAGSMAYLMDACHNQDFDTPRRVRSVEEFADIVLAVAEVQGSVLV